MRLMPSMLMATLLPVATFAESAPVAAFDHYCIQTKLAAKAIDRTVQEAGGTSVDFKTAAPFLADSPAVLNKQAWQVEAQGMHLTIAHRRVKGDIPGRKGLLDECSIIAFGIPIAQIRADLEQRYHPLLAMDDPKSKSPHMVSYNKDFSAIGMRPLQVVFTDPPNETTMLTTVNSPNDAPFHPTLQ